MVKTSKPIETAKTKQKYSQPAKDGGPNKQIKQNQTLRFHPAQ